MAPTWRLIPDGTINPDGTCQGQITILPRFMPDYPEFQFPFKVLLSTHALRDHLPFLASKMICHVLLCVPCVFLSIPRQVHGGWKY